jgi:hypothetical protein
MPRVFVLDDTIRRIFSLYPARQTKRNLIWGENAQYYFVTQIIRSLSRKEDDSKMKTKIITFTISFVSLMIVATGIWLTPSIASGNWESKAPMPDIRAGVASGVIGGKLYIAGGSDSFGNKPLSTIVYDGSANSWSYAAGTMNIARGRSLMASGVIGGKLYAAEGWINSDSSESTKVLEIYNPIADTWTFGPSSLVARGNSASAVIVKNST